MKIIKIIFTSMLLSIVVIANAAVKDKTVINVNIEKKPSWAETAYGKRLFDEQQVGNNMYAVNLFKPNYVLPFYYTFKPARRIYGTTTPDRQKLRQLEFEAQFSFKVPIIHHLINKDTSLNFAYTQLMMWQVYVNSPYFRETNYMPEIFVTHHYGKHWTGRYSIMHQSNGRGGDMERSWNRVYAESIYSNRNWMVSIRPWVTFAIGKNNPQIRRYLGNSDITAAYKTDNNIVFSVMTRNNVQSGFKRGAEQVNMSFPLFGHFKGYVKFTSGYGQTLIEYNHYTNAVGIGLVLNDWI